MRNLVFCRKTICAKRQVNTLTESWMFQVKINYLLFCGSILMVFKYLKRPQFILLVFQFSPKSVAKWRFSHRLKSWKLNYPCQHHIKKNISSAFVLFGSANYLPSLEPCQKNISCISHELPFFSHASTKIGTKAVDLRPLGHQGRPSVLKDSK